ncbi:unnamed protein product [Ceratitis capitata]|uniref:(Mediterranean fruit fly) hypothetical protein n=1 Tax=Ceratitis capitata TaxID=7213 RepID=A0A811UPI6_CERCA|nr:unnamed protein product [Ceratitis capitata]
MTSDLSLAASRNANNISAINGRFPFIYCTLLCIENVNRKREVVNYTGSAAHAPRGELPFYTTTQRVLYDDVDANLLLQNRKTLWQPSIQLTARSIQHFAALKESGSAAHAPRGELPFYTTTQRVLYDDVDANLLLQNRKTLWQPSIQLTARSIQHFAALKER